MDLTNKALALILVIATSLSLFGTLVTVNQLDSAAHGSITGRAPTDTATTNFSIESTVSVVFTTDTADFGVGTINQSNGDNACILNTSYSNANNGLDSGALNCTGFNDVVPALVIQNQGTLNVTLNVSFNSTADQFIGGSVQQPLLHWRVSENETGACAGTTGLNVSTHNATQNTNVTVCNSTLFDWESGSRTLNLDIGLKIPQDANPGDRVVVITAYATNP